jgi:hypothetical protein
VNSEILLVRKVKVGLGDRLHIPCGNGTKEMLN